MFWQMLGVCLVGSWLASGQEKKRKNLQERRKQWLEENGYNRKKRTELELGAMKNKCEAIEAAYGYLCGSVENDRMYLAWMNKKPPFSWEKMVGKLCEKNGFKYFNEHWPPEEYRNIK